MAQADDACARSKAGAFARMADYARLLQVILKRNIGVLIGMALMVILIIGGTYEALYSALDQTTRSDIQSRTMQWGAGLGQALLPAEDFSSWSGPGAVRRTVLEEMRAFVVDKFCLSLVNLNRIDKRHFEIKENTLINVPF